MRTNFINIETGSTVAYGETIDRVYFYDNGVILGEVEQFQERKPIFNTSGKAAIMEKTGDTVYDGTAENIYIYGDVKRANKLNLSRKDNFIVKNPDYTYKIDRPYILYLNIKAVDDFILYGDVLAADHNHEKCYLETYAIKFPKVEFKRSKFEKFPDLENYTLQEGESFSGWHGVDPEHKTVWPYDTTKSRFNKSTPGEKGIIKRWREKETNNNYIMYLTKRCYTKIIYDDFRTEARETAEKLNNILGNNSHLSYFDIEKLMNSGVKISFEK